MLSPEPVGQASGDKVQHSLDQAERKHEGEKKQKGALCHAKLPRQRGKNGSLHSDDEAHEKDLEDLVEELAPVDPDSPAVGGGGLRSHAPSFRSWEKGRISVRLFRFSESVSIWSRMIWRMRSQTSSTLGLVTRYRQEVPAFSQ